MALEQDLGSSLDAVAFLARSVNRVRTLDALTDGPRERAELAEEVGASRATLARILDDFEARGWAERDGRTYRATQVGAFVASEFTDLLERLDAVQSLARVARWFPDEEFDFDIDRLADAEVVTADRTDVLAPTTHLVRRLARAERVRVLSHALLPDSIEASWHRTTDGRQRIEAVVTRAVVSAIRADDEIARQVREMLATGRADVYRYAGEVPYVLVVTGEDANIVLFDADGAPHAVICSGDETVVSWAESTFRSYREAATPLGTEAFTP